TPATNSLRTSVRRAAHRCIGIPVRTRARSASRWAHLPIPNYRRRSAPCGSVRSMHGSNSPCSTTSRKDALEMKSMAFPRTRVALLYVLSLGVVGYAAVAYGFLPLGALVNPDMQAAYHAHSLGIYTHIAGAMVALALGPFQFSARLRTRRVAVHR